MKNSVTKIIALLVITTVISSCGIDMLNKISGNKNVVSKERKTPENFTKIKVSTGIDVYITQGSKNKITVEADENLHKIIITEIENGTLKIYTDENIWKSTAKKVHVTIKNLEYLSATSGSDVYSKNTLKSEKITVNATSGADINFAINTIDLETNATSGADINITGTATNHNTSATSGSAINAYDLVSKNVVAKATSGANINVFVSDNITANATSAGDIDFKGTPTQVSKSVNSGGSVQAKDMQ